MNSPSISRSNKPESRYNKRSKTNSARQRQLRKAQRRLISTLIKNPRTQH